MLRKIVSYLLLTVLFTALLAVIQEQANLDYRWLAMPQLAPGLGFFALWLFSKKERNAPIVIQWNSQETKIILPAILIPLSLTGAAYFLGSFIFETPVSFEQSPDILFWVSGIILGAAGEEIGWRSYLQAMLEKQYAMPISSLITGLCWGLWHIGHYSNGVLFMLGFLIFCGSASVIIGFLFSKTAYNLILTTAFHAAINLGFFLFFKSDPSNANLMLANGFVWALLALIWLYKKQSTQALIKMDTPTEFKE